MKISVILPAYQEADNLREILPQLNGCLAEIGEEYEILVIDTQKPMDDTGTVCKELGGIHINRAGGDHYGDAIRTGIGRANGDYLVVMDADGSHDPEMIKRFYQEIDQNGYDLVIGSRYCKGGDSHNGFILKLMSWILNCTYRIIFGLNVKDVSDSFRMYRTYQVNQLKLECENFDIVEEILIRMSIKFTDLKVKEIPIYFQKRIYGRSKRDLLKFIRSYLETIRRLLQIKRQEHRGQDF